MNAFVKGAKRRAAQRAAIGEPPAADLGYCTCGTIWNVEAMAAEHYERGHCPDCGAKAAFIEQGRNEPQKTEDAMETCNHAGCGRAATHHLVAKIWAKGFDKSAHSPIQMTIGMMLCREHAEEETKAKTIFGQEMWNVVEGVCKNAGKAPPDRASLELEIVEGSPGLPPADAQSAELGSPPRPSQAH